MGGGISTIISFITKYVGTGANAAAAGIGKVKNVAALATHGLSQVGSVVSGLDGKFVQAAQGVTNFMASIQTMGAVGGIISGANTAITLIANHFIKKAEAMKASVDKMRESLRSTFENMKAKSLEDINAQLEKATTRAAEAAKRFEALASAYMKVEQAKQAVDSSEGRVKTSAISLEKERTISATRGDNAKALVGAEYDVRIAEQELANTIAAQDGSLSAARTEASDSATRARNSRQTEKAAQIAAQKAQAEFDRYEQSGKSANEYDEIRRKKDEAAKALVDATNNRIVAVANAEAAEIRVAEAEYNRVVAINNARAALENARNTQSELIAAQTAAAKAELERAAAERAAAKAAKAKADRERMENERAENASLLSGARDSFAAKFNSAFDLWRDPDAAASAVKADKKRFDDMKAFRKAVNRYGGKGKIDEYAQLMRQGDEDGMQERLAEWRKSSKFTPQVEQMVKAAAADQNRNAAEKSLAQIEKNTGDLAKKIDELLRLK